MTLHPEIAQVTRQVTARAVLGIGSAPIELPSQPAVFSNGPESSNVPSREISVLMSLDSAVHQQMDSQTQ